MKNSGIVDYLLGLGFWKEGGPHSDYLCCGDVGNVHITICGEEVNSLPVDKGVVGIAIYNGQDEVTGSITIWAGDNFNLVQAIIPGLLQDIRLLNLSKQ
jgi:hypothetical protein